MLLTLSGPSAAGKTTLSRFLKTCCNASELPSYTTRSRRKGEATDYYRFLTVQEYAQYELRGELVLQDEFANARYGTRKEDLQTAIQDDALWVADFTSTSVIDCIRSGYVPTISLFLYISKAMSRERMLLRGDNANEIQARLDAFAGELEGGVRLGTITPDLIFLDASLRLSEVEHKVRGVVSAMRQNRRWP
jgi:guanylate kinase